MAFKFAQRQVADPAAQQNFEQLEAVLGTGVFDTGDLKPTARATAPAGWLLCDGSALEATHPAQTLRAALIADGMPYGNVAGDPKLPDLRGRVPLGAGQGAGLTNRALGASVGGETHTLTATEMPSHNHGGGTGTDSPDHSHNHTDQWMQYAGVLSAPGSSYSVYVPADRTLTSAGANQRHTHSIPSQGGGGAHNNMQPSLAINWLIRI